MRKPPRLASVIWGLLTIVIAVLMLQAGVREVLAYRGQGGLPGVMGVLGAAASSLLLVSGFALLTRSRFARSTAMAGAISMIAVHLVGWMLGIVGLGGALPGVGYPILLLVVLMARPNLGAPANAAGSDGRAEPSSPTGHSHRREAMTLS